MNDVAIVIPVYREGPTPHESVSLHRCFTVLRDYPVILLAPRGLDTSRYQMECRYVTVRELDGKWFRSVHDYNALLLSPCFYELFDDFSLILIYQLDAFVFSDRLREFCAFGYDYIGAPWLAGEAIQRFNFPFSVQLNRLFPRFNPQRTCHVGNGGFSLRRPAACRRLLEAVGGLGRKLSLNEDGFFSYHGSERGTQFRLAPLDVAVDFAFEKNFVKCLELNHNRLPFGCHAWQRTDDDRKWEVLGRFLPAPPEQWHGLD